MMTPALVLDLDAFEQNINAYQQLINAHGLKARPHAKSHKCAEIARRQIATGSVGISTATLHEAEALAEKGIPDILITSPIVGLAKRERLLQLLESDIVLAIVVDNPEQVPLPSAGHVLNVERFGDSALLYLESAEVKEPIVMRTDGATRLKRGDPVALALPETHLHVFDAEGQALTRSVDPLAP